MDSKRVVCEKEVWTDGNGEEKEKGARGGEASNAASTPFHLTSCPPPTRECKVDNTQQEHSRHHQSKQHSLTPQPPDSPGNAHPLIQPHHVTT